MLLFVVVCCCLLLFVVVCCCLLLFVVVCCCLLLFVVVCCCLLLFVACWLVVCWLLVIVCWLLVVCCWLQSDVTTRVQVCSPAKRAVSSRLSVNCHMGLGCLEDSFAHCKRCEMDICLHACHVNCQVGVGVGCNDVVERARMVDATYHLAFWVGVGVGCNDIVERAGMVDAT